MVNKEDNLEFERRVDYLIYLESIGWKLSENAWFDVWKYHKNYDKDSPMIRAFEDNFCK